MNEDIQKYADIIDLEHPTSKRHPRMPLIERAGQFAAFAALTGYDSMINEVTQDSMTERSDYEWMDDSL